MRSAAVLLLVTLPLLAGCTTSDENKPGPSTPPPDTGASKFLNVQVTNVNGPANEVTVAVNPKDPLNLIGGGKDYTLGEDPDCGMYRVWSGYYWSKDGGTTWGNGLMPGYPGDANRTILSHYRCNSDPVVVFGSDGTAYYSGLSYGGPGEQRGLCPSDAQTPVCGSSIWIASSKNGGETWENFVNVATSDDVNVGLDKQWFATYPNDPKALDMGWIQFTGVGAYFMIAHSSDGALTWTPPLTVAEVELPVHQFIMPQVGADGTTYVTWRSFATLGILPPTTPLGGSIIFTKNVQPNSPTFLPGISVAPVVDIPSPLPNSEFRTGSLPVLAVDTRTADGSLYIAWPDYAKGNSDILLVKSSDKGMTWSAPKQVNLDADDSDQFMPWMVVDKNGGVVIAYIDRHFGGNNTAMDITLARSTDGGSTFKTERVTGYSWLPNKCHHQVGFEFIGDYQGLAVGTDLVAHPFWASGLTGPCEVYSAAVPLS